MQEMCGHGTDRDADHPAVIVCADDDECRTNAVDFVSKRIEWMSFEKPCLDRA